MRGAAAVRVPCCVTACLPRNSRYHPSPEWHRSPFPGSSFSVSPARDAPYLYLVRNIITYPSIPRTRSLQDPFFSPFAPLYFPGCSAAAPGSTPLLMLFRPRRCRAPCGAEERSSPRRPSVFPPIRPSVWKGRRLTARSQGEGQGVSRRQRHSGGKRRCAGGEVWGGSGRRRRGQGGGERKGSRGNYGHGGRYGAGLCGRR